MNNNKQINGKIPDYIKSKLKLTYFNHESMAFCPLLNQSTTIESVLSITPSELKSFILNDLKFSTIYL